MRFRVGCGVGFLFFPVLLDSLDGGEGACGYFEVYFGGYRAEGWVLDDLFKGRFGCGWGLLRGGESGEVDAGDLEAVEEEAGAAGVELVEGDAGEDGGDGLLDGGAVFDEGEVEGGAAAFALAGVLDGTAGGVMEVAEGLAAKAGAAALAAVGVDVAAAEACGVGCGEIGWCLVVDGVPADGVLVLHGVVSPYPGLLCKIFKGWDLGLYQHALRVR